MKAAKAKTVPLRLLKALTSDIVASAMDAIISVDESQSVVLFNDAAAKMFRCTREEALGQKLDFFIPKHLRGPHREYMENFEGTGNAMRSMGHFGAVYGLRADGEEFPLEASLSKTEIDGQKISTVILRDATERFLAEESQARLAAIVESSHDAIIGKDLDGVVTSWNHGAELLFGYTAEEMIGQPLTRLLPPERLVEEEEILCSIRQGEWVKRFDTVRQCKDGRLLDVSITVSPIKNAIGRVVGASKVARDVTERKLVEQDLRQREESFRLLIEYASDLITVVDEHGVIHFQSPSIERVLNFKPEKIMGRNLAEISHPEDRDRLISMLRRAIENPTSPVAIEYRVRHRDGDWHLFASVGRSLPGSPHGKRVVFNSRDITANRNLEEQLLQAQKMEAIGTLAGGIAHDFNNMLAGILGSVELVREDLGPSHPSQEFVQSIMLAANRARELVQQILTFSRRRESEKRVLALQPLVAECIKLIRSTIPAMVKITYRVDSQCPSVLADPTQIHQVIMNVCTNAWHALPESGGHIDINLHAVQMDPALTGRQRELWLGSYVRLSITDNGHGMDAATRERIFEPFFTTKPATKGSGLGLSVVHGIIKSHRGEIVVESEVGRGTTFEIYLPARLESRKESALAAPRFPQGHGERILYVDDEPIVSRSTEEFLKRLGYEVSRHEQAEAALAQFRQTPENFDLIITDWAMPGMSGTELVSAIREEGSDIPALLISGSAGPLIEKAAKSMRIGEILVKPVDPEMMAQAVTVILARAASARAVNSILAVDHKHP